MAETHDAPPVTFGSLVLTLASSAAVHFGDLGDPETGDRTEPNLDGVQQMIDLLAMLEEKTRGNLTAEERTLLERVLYELRLRFVDVTQDAGQKRIIVP